MEIEQEWAIRLQDRRVFQRKDGLFPAGRSAGRAGPLW
jgi:hypothetical protein